jgi:hypothetical protein
MNRGWIASLSVCAAVAGGSQAQDPTPVSVIPGRAVVISSAPEPGRAPAPLSLEDQPVKPVEQPQVKAPEPLPAPATPPTGAGSCTDAGRKPSLAVSHCGPPQQVWFRASYLNYSVSDLPIPQILATVNGVPAIGGQDVDLGQFNGGRIEAGGWFDCRHTFGFEFGGFLLQERSRSFSAAGDGSIGSPVVGRPIVDALPNVPVTFVVAQPGNPNIPGIAGRINVDVSSQLGSFEANLVRNVLNNECWTLDLLAGARYIDLQEDVSITTDSQALAGAPFTMNGSPAQYDRLTIADRFRTRNQVWAGQVGARAEYRRGIFFLGARGSVAIGPNQQTSEITGSSTAFQTAAGGQAGGAGGLLAVPGGPTTLFDGTTTNQPYANAGTQRTDWWVVAPEVGLQVGMQATRSIRVHLGYNLLYINNVVRPGDLIDTTVNSRFVPANPLYGNQSGPDRPRLSTSRDDFLAHGVEVGFQLLF